jgi:hypothetical protein
MPHAWRRSPLPPSVVCLLLTALALQDVSAGDDPVCRSSSAPAECREIGLGPSFELTPGRCARVADAGLEVVLVEAHGPRPDCTDCPNRATLRVVREGRSEELKFSFSGNMPMPLLEKARRRSAHGYQFVVMRIVEGNITLMVEKKGG